MKMLSMSGGVSFQTGDGAICCAVMATNTVAPTATVMSLAEPRNLSAPALS